MRSAASSSLFGTAAVGVLDLPTVGSLVVVAWASGTNASTLPDRRVVMDTIATLLGTAPDDVRRLLHVVPHVDGIEVAEYDLCMAGAWREGLIEMRGIDLIRRIDRRAAKASLDGLTQCRPELKMWLRSIAEALRSAERNRATSEAAR